MSEEFDQQWWDERYQSAPALFSGRANVQLVAEVSDLPPGRVLDAGCGEGGDAFWLAERGWQVDAVDISPVALARAAGEAERRGLAGRIRFQQADLTVWAPQDQYDLVSAFYVHPASAVRGSLYGRLAAAVAPGGHLLLVQHDSGDHALTSPALLDRCASPDQLAADLDPVRWDILTAATRERTGSHAGHDGEVQRHDAVLVARRR
jgi:SAM-dependent methyltransferase